MLRKLYDRIMALAASPRAEAWLALVAFLESSVFPAPPDLMLGPMALARPDRAWRYAAVCTLASVAGGILGYGIGFFAQPLAEALLRLIGKPDALAAFQATYARWGVWVILIKGLTPIPYKLVTIASGLAEFSFPVFLAASVVTRGARFFLVAGLIRIFGASVRDFVEKRLTLVTTAFAILIVLGFVALKVL